jgi:hypothetical protein
MNGDIFVNTLQTLSAPQPSGDFRPHSEGNFCMGKSLPDQRPRIFAEILIYARAGRVPVSF